MPNRPVVATLLLTPQGQEMLEGIRRIPAIALSGPDADLLAYRIAAGDAAAVEDPLGGDGADAAPDQVDPPARPRAADHLGQLGDLAAASGLYADYVARIQGLGATLATDQGKVSFLQDHAAAEKKASDLSS